MQSLILLLPIVATSARSIAANNSYYDGVNWSLKGDALRAELSKLNRQHKVVSYKAVWSAFDFLDDGIDRCGNGTIRGIYSSKCWAPSEQCGNYKKEGDCFDREHVWPKSWWGGFSKGQGAQTDLFLLFPADGYVNNLRGNLPLGMVSDPTYTSTSNAKVGPCVTPGSNGGRCFEPPDMFKGAIARAYFYISTAYYDMWSCCDTDSTDKANIKPWMANQLLKWHFQFPIAPAEREINEEVFQKYQYN